ncbi:MAG: PAS domain-containing sensor histidine kinase [Planctomycetes bacterium]|nr:PAS domain-containing sensor histidine kinase [Planctomycetota bacterium]
MRQESFTPETAPPPARLEFAERRAFVRTWILAASICAVALVFEAPWPVVWLTTSGAVLAMLIERNGMRAEATQRIALIVNSARTEGQRDAIAQVMSLQLAYERSRSVFEALREGVVVVDAGGEIVLANPAARRAMQAPLADPVGRLLWEALTPELAASARDAWQALRQSSRSPSELPLVRYSAIPCRDSVYDLTAVEATSSRTGQDFGSVFLLVDTTRVYELQRLKDRFLSSVSHELRTPLTNICAYAEILDGMTPQANAAGHADEWPEFVRVIHEEGLQLSRLVDAMFDYLQLEGGEARFANDRIDGAGIVRAVAAEFATVLQRRCIVFDCRIPGEAMVLMGDGRRLEQIARNLLDNAIKFTPEGGRVQLTVAWRDEAFELRVEDSGPGVPVDDRQLVFEKFHQLRDHMTDKPTGTGLGLATSRAIVARFGGLIWCEDSPLGGAGFVVLLPGLGQPRLASIGAGAGNAGAF